MKRVITAALIIVKALAATPDFEQYLSQAEKNWSQVKNFTAKFHARELIKDRIKEQRNTEMKFIQPLKVYLRWTEGDDKGQELIYNPALYGTKLQVHAGGWLNVINLELDPKGPRATKNARHTIYEAGIGYLINLVKKNYNLTKTTGKGWIKRSGEEMVDGKPADVFLAELPPGHGFYAHRILICLDRVNKLPVKIDVHGFNGEFLESYWYTDLKFNTTLTEKDFSTDNPDYDF